MTADSFTRRHLMKAIGVFGSSSVVGGAVGEPTRSTAVSETQLAWPQPGGTPTNSGYRGVAGGPSSNVALRWEFTESTQLSGVVAADSTVYASDDRTLYALSAHDGSKQWTVGGELRRLSAPAVGGAHVYVGCTPAHVRAIDTETGATAWRFEPADPVATFHHPTITDGNVYVVGQNVGAGTAGRLYALDGPTGRLLWSHDTGQSAINGYGAPPVAVADGIAYLAAEKLVALDGRSGTVEWSIDPDGTYKAMGTNAPAVADGRLYIGRGTATATTFEARSVADGSLEWSHTPTHPGVWTAPAVVDGSVYVGFNERSPRTNRRSLIIALRAADGAVRWQRAFTDTAVYTPASDGRTLYTGPTALGLDDGTVRWQIPRDPFAPPAIADRTVYVGGRSLRAISEQS